MCQGLNVAIFQLARFGITAALGKGFPKKSKKNLCRATCTAHPCFCVCDLAFCLFPVELGSQVDMAVLEREIPNVLPKEVLMLCSFLPSQFQPGSSHR